MDVDDEIGEIVHSFEHRQGLDDEPLFCRKYTFPVMAAVMLATFNQLTGINALLYYAPRVFAMGNSDPHAALLQSIPVGIMLVISTFVGMMVIDRFGRKTLLLVGSVGMVVFLASVAVQFYSADNRIFVTMAAPANVVRISCKVRPSTTMARGLMTANSGLL